MSKFEHQNNARNFGILLPLKLWHENIYNFALPLPLDEIFFVSTNFRFHEHSFLLRSSVKFESTRFFIFRSFFISNVRFKKIGSVFLNFVLFFYNWFYICLFLEKNSLIWNIFSITLFCPRRNAINE